MWKFFSFSITGWWSIVGGSNDNASNTVEPFDIKDELRFWVLKFKVSHNSANCILRIIKSAGINVPKDIRTLMKTPKTYNF